MRDEGAWGTEKLLGVAVHGGGGHECQAHGRDPGMRGLCVPVSAGAVSR